MAVETRFCGTGAGLLWTSPGNITADDNVDAYYAGAVSVFPALKATNFGFSIPAGATIDNLSVIMGRYRVTGTVIDNSVRWTKDNVTTVGADIDAGATWNPLVEQQDTLTGLGGSSFTPAEINASTFGVWIVAEGTDVDAEADVDYVKVTVTYTPASSFVPKVAVF